MTQKQKRYLKKRATSIIPLIVMSVWAGYICYDVLTNYAHEELWRILASTGGFVVFMLLFVFYIKVSLKQYKALADQTH